jgi:hypothetical protein
VTTPEWAERLRQIKRRTAVHEAGHAIIAREIGWRVVNIQTADFLLVEEAQHGGTWGLTTCAASPSDSRALVGAFQALAGYVADCMFGPDAVAFDGDDFGRVNNVHDYISELREAEGDEVGDFAAAWESLEMNLDLPAAMEPELLARSERELAFDWAVLRTCRLVIPHRVRILRLAQRVENLGPGERIEEAEIRSVLASSYREGRDVGDDSSQG